MGTHSRQIPIIQQREQASCPSHEECDHATQDFAGWSQQELVIVQQLRQTVSDIARLRQEAANYPESPARDEIIAFYDLQFKDALDHLRQVEQAVKPAPSGE